MGHHFGKHRRGIEESFDDAEEGKCRATRSLKRLFAQRSRVKKARSLEPLSTQGRAVHVPDSSPGLP
jgi:hypothetical protein